MTETHVTRRQFLQQLTVLSAGALGAGSLLPMTAQADAQTLVPAGKASSYRTGEVRSVVLPGGGKAYVQKLPGKQGAFLALNGACTHKGCPVAWVAAQDEFVCPCHGGRYNQTGTNISGPPPRPLAVMPTQIDKDDLFVVA